MTLQYYDCHFDQKMLLFRKRVIKPCNLGKRESRLEPISIAMHSNVYAPGCNWLLARSIAVLPTCSYYRNVIGALDIEFAAKLMFVLFMPEHQGPVEADGTPMIMGYRCCSTSRPLMAMQKRRDIGPEEKSGVWRDVGGRDEFVFVSRRLSHPFQPPLNCARCI